MGATGPGPGATDRVNLSKRCRLGNHRALKCWGSPPRDRRTGQVTPPLWSAGYGETLPFGWRGHGGDPTAEGQSRGGFGKAIGV